MPDWSKCVNEDCPQKEYCWRYKAPPSEYMQSYHRYEPLNQLVHGQVICSAFKSKPKNSTKRKTIPATTQMNGCSTLGTMINLNTTLNYTMGQ
jgi:hypothetical protein